MFYTFQSMQEAVILDRNNDLHLFVLHFPGGGGTAIYGLYGYVPL